MGCMSGEESSGGVCRLKDFEELVGTLVSVDETQSRVTVTTTIQVELSSSLIKQLKSKLGERIAILNIAEGDHRVRRA